MTREEAIQWLTDIKENITENWSHDVAIDMAIEALQADAEPTMTEEVREALMRLTMCAREECGMCKYKDECGFDFQYNISTENMHTILDALSADAEQEVVPTVVRVTMSDGSQYYLEHERDAIQAVPRSLYENLLLRKDRPHGKWYQIKDHKVMGEGYMWHCSICDYKVYQDSSADYPHENFCPNCGAQMDMRGE